MPAPTHGLEGASATLLLVLAARALARLDAPELKFNDPAAERILHEMHLDPHDFHLNRREAITVVLRAQWFADRQREFFERYPDGVALNFGCGLTASYEQVADAAGGRFSWFDFDLAPVIALRGKFFADCARRRMVIGDATRDPFDQAPWRSGQPALVNAEGLLYYLRPAAVAAFLRGAVRAADKRSAPMEMLFDYASPLAARYLERHPAHRQFGSRYDWTLKQPRELMAIEPRLEILEDSDQFAGAMHRLSRTINAIHRMVTGGNLGGCMHLRLAHATAPPP